jgi:hypothetical protein
MPIDPSTRTLVDAVIASGRNKRAVAALKFMLEHGQITTDDLLDLGYSHPPRAIGDVKDAGVPIVKVNGRSERTGRLMAIYKLGNASEIDDGRFAGGRSVFPKAFKRALVDRYGSVDCITGARLNERVLQIDHRIPFRVAGDAEFAHLEVDAYMLLDASSQRAKSWSCETCPNMIAKDVRTCGTCFWAHPESYLHIATEQIRRTDISWQGEDVLLHDQLATQARAAGVPVGDLIKSLVRRTAKRT